MTPPHEATLLLEQICSGDRHAAEKLLPLIYDQLRGLAGGLFTAQPADHTLQPTALVHEAYLRLVRAEDRAAGGEAPGAFNSRAHFIAVAATAMRHILTDHARRRNADKRGGGRGMVSLDAAPEVAPADGGAVDTLVLTDALSALARLDERRARVVEMRFFGGLTVDEIAEVLGVSKTTVESDWRSARAWLKVRLAGEEPTPA